mmetsp:Transcript_2592/g.7202  ORF Transcript_2592/g.7202 Transcript_2592/m.7202 type:complete len:252 (-) Transcript_2592:321-1076(-)
MNCSSMTPCWTRAIHSSHGRGISKSPSWHRQTTRTLPRTTVGNARSMSWTTRSSRNRSLKHLCARVFGPVATSLTGCFEMMELINRNGSMPILRGRSSWNLSMSSNNNNNSSSTTRAQAATEMKTTTVRFDSVRDNRFGHWCLRHHRWPKLCLPWSAGLRRSLSTANHLSDGGCSPICSCPGTPLPASCVRCSGSPCLHRSSSSSYWTTRASSGRNGRRSRPASIPSRAFLMWLNLSGTTSAPSSSPTYGA